MADSITVVESIDSLITVSETEYIIQSAQGPQGIKGDTGDVTPAATAAKEAAEAAALSASASAATAATAATTATTQASIATTQTGIATTQAGIATTKAGEADASADAAALSATAAAGSANAAQTSADAAYVSAGDASSSATAAGAARDDAQAAEVNSGDYAAAAEAARDAALAAQGAAETAASNADGFASAASGSADAAASSASAAALSASDADADRIAAEAAAAAAAGGAGIWNVRSANFTAANDAYYTATATLTVTDPTPAEGKGFWVQVRNGTATVGGTAYATAGTLIRRVYHSGAWATYLSPLTSRAISTTAPLQGGGDLSANRTLTVDTATTTASGVVPGLGGYTPTNAATIRQTLGAEAFQVLPGVTFGQVSVSGTGATTRNFLQSNPRTGATTGSYAECQSFQTQWSAGSGSNHVNWENFTFSCRINAPTLSGNGSSYRSVFAAGTPLSASGFSGTFRGAGFSLVGVSGAFELHTVIGNGSGATETGTGQSIVTGRNYDLRVSVVSGTYRLYLDGTLISTITSASVPTGSINSTEFRQASSNPTAGEINVSMTVLKVNGP